MAVILMVPAAWAGGDQAKEVTSLEPIKKASANTWFRIKDTHLRTVAPDPNKYPNIQANRGVHGVIDGWSGGDYDSGRRWFFIFGGGHWAYGGNEVYIFDLNKLKWIRYTDPTNDPVHGKDPQPDGTPISRHTYGGVACLEHSGKLFAIGGSPFARAGGCGLKNTWLFDYDRKEWNQMKPKGYSPQPRCGNWSDYDPERKQVWFVDKNSLLRYDDEKNRWSRVSPFNVKYDTGIVLDPERDRIYAIGKDTFWYYDIKNDQLQKQVSSRGGDAIVRSSQMGLDYDPVANRIVVWNGNRKVWTLNPETHEWNAHEARGAPVDTDEEKFVERVYGRWRYVESVNAFITVTSVDADVYFYKLTAGMEGR